MGYADEYKLVWAGLIVSQYEKAAMEASVREQNRDACAVSWLKSMKAMEMTLDSSERVVKGESPNDLATAMFGLSGTESDPDQDPTPSTKDQKNIEWGDKDGNWWGGVEWSGEGIRRDLSAGGENTDKNACDVSPHSWESIVNPDVEFQGFGVETPGFKVDAHWDGAKALGDGLAALGVPIESLPEDMDSYLENCWSCMLNLDFSWQVPPINLLAEIENLLKMLEDLIDWMLSRYDSSYDFLKEMLCDWDWIWKMLCWPDLIALMAMLRGLLMKYMMDFFGLTLDWTGIVGPIIKAVVDALAALIEQIVALILQPIDCLIGVLKTIDAFIHGVVDLAVTTWDFGQHIANVVTFGAFDIGGGGGGSPGAFEASFGAENNMKFAPAWSDIVPDWGDNNKGPNKTDDPGEAPAASASWTGPATGFSFGAGTTLSGATEKGVFKKPEFNALGSMILGLQELRSWIDQLAQQLIYAIKSLSLLFGGQLKLSVMKSGLIMLIIDMIALVKAIMELIAKGLDGFCNEEEAEDVAAILGEIYGKGSEFSVIGGQSDDSARGLAIRARRTADGTIVDIPISECSLDISRLPDNIKMPFDALQENTEYRREKWGI